MTPKPSPHRFVILWLLLCAVVGPVRSSGGNNAGSEASIPMRQFSESTGANRCAFCHQSEVEGYARSAMAHSLRRAGQEPDGTVETSDTKIAMRSSPSGYWQRLEDGGDITNYRIDYVIGSGNHASGYLVDIADHLYQSPVAYYTSRHAYDLAPGYEGRPNPDFTRPIAEQCLFCHAGGALHISGTSNQYRSPPFSAEAITCERCHGSATKHLADPRAGTIINPAKLEPAARDSICEQCHLLGVSRVLNPGKHFSDYRPGQPLEDVFTTYCNALPPGAEAGKFKVISHVEQLAKSTCARRSNGQLWCGTCHDPHTKQLDPVQFYRSKCLSCHTGSFAAAHPARDSNCIGCHMPRRDAQDGGHTAFTDHRIRRRPDPQPDLPAEDTDIAAWREPTPDLQKRNLGMAYINVGMERHSRSVMVRGYRLLTEVQTQFSSDSEIFAAMGAALLLGKQTSEAELAFERALQLNPDAAGETNAASAYLEAGDIDKAIAHLERATVLDPFHLPAVAPLISLYRKQGDFAKAAELSARLSAAIEGQSAPYEPHGTVSSRTADTVFKNLQVLKDVPSDRLIPAMRFITASLGVECGYCHVDGHFEKDDKKPKQTAREMMRMMLTLNRDSFRGDREVTCYSCHRGSPKPIAIPIIRSEPQPSREMTERATLAPEKLAAKLPTADEIVTRYIQALGGRAAIEKINSREERGTTVLGGKSTSVEVFNQDPNKLAVVRHTSGGDSASIFNGQAGWVRTPDRPIRNMEDSDVDAARMDADLQFPLHIKQEFAELAVEYSEKIGESEAYVLSGSRVGQPPVKFYFDQRSGLLMRLVRYDDSLLGLDPTQIDYGDYRDVDGLKVPFRLTVAQPEGNSVIQLEAVQQNVPIDDAVFTKPTAPRPPKF
jgi:photosynthetic reaction center cytochrome c subunit